MLGSRFDFAKNSVETTNFRVENNQTCLVRFREELGRNVEFPDRKTKHAWFECGELGRKSKITNPGKSNSGTNSGTQERTFFGSIREI